MDGVFQVKDAYSIAQAAHEDASCSLGLDPLWSTVWRLYIPPKARIFLWRALSDIFPHGVNLRSKGIEGVGACPRCGETENNLHVLINYPWSQKVWQSLPNFPSARLCASFKERFPEIVNQRQSINVELVCLCAWQIWSARNDFCFEKILNPPEACFGRANDILMEYHKANVCTGKSSRIGRSSWQCPEPEFIKIKCCS